MKTNQTSSMIATLETQRQDLCTHPLSQAVSTLDDWRLFMQVHVFAVFDFMSLLKRLQGELTCMTLPWRPPAHPELARLINEIVLGEESDIDQSGKPYSHFESYLEAMAAVDADRSSILGFLSHLEEGLPWREALRRANVPECVRPFLQETLSCALEGQIHEVAAAFFYGRENLLPAMFSHFLAGAENDSGQLAPLKRYFQRHIEVDGDHHGPMAQRMLEVLCARDPDRLAQAQATAQAALEARRRLWDALLTKMGKNL